MMVQIKRGSPVFQDFGFYRWPDLRHKTADVDTIFELEHLKDNRAKLTSSGYGHPHGEYGDGAIMLWNWRQHVTNV